MREPGLFLRTDVDFAQSFVAFPQVIAAFRAPTIRTISADPTCTYSCNGHPTIVSLAIPLTSIASKPTFLENTLAKTVVGATYPMTSS